MDVKTMSENNKFFISEVLFLFFEGRVDTYKTK
jgi:hypothetical protein